MGLQAELPVGVLGTIGDRGEGVFSQLWPVHRLQEKGQEIKAFELLRVTSGLRIDEL